LAANLATERRVPPMTRTEPLLHDPGVSRYETLERFYAADPRRISSREQDVGLWWRERSDGPLHRAAWVSETGELYLARLGPDAGSSGARVEVLAREPDGERVEAALSGWREQCGEPGSLRWLRERARGLRGAPALRRRARPGSRRVRRVEPAPMGPPSRGTGGSGAGSQGRRELEAHGTAQASSL